MLIGVVLKVFVLTNIRVRNWRPAHLFFEECWSFMGSICVFMLIRTLMFTLGINMSDLWWFDRDGSTKYDVNGAQNINHAHS